MAKMARLATTRLRFRPVTPSDVDTLHHLWTEPGVRKYLWDDLEKAGMRFAERARIDDRDTIFYTISHEAFAPYRVWRA